MEGIKDGIRNYRSNNQLNFRNYNIFWIKLFYKHTIFRNFGPLAIFGVWLGCTVVAYIIVGWFSGIILGFFSILWTLIKIGLLIAAIVYVYKKLTSKKKTGEENQYEFKEK